MPTYGYELAQVVKDGYLVDFLSVESSLKFIDQGIVYDELSEEDRETYEATFRNENGDLPEKIGSAKVIENYMTYAQSAINEFSEPGKLPQIAISVDMLGTGIDVPEVLNLVFFKKVMSKAKFCSSV